MNVVSPQRLDPILTSVEGACDRGDLQLACVQLRDFFKIDHLVYQWVSGVGEPYGLGTYAPEWLGRYARKGYLRVDPVVRGCSQSFHPVDWRDLDWTSKTARAFADDALTHGVGHQGVSVPLRGPNGQFALFTANHSCDGAHWSGFIDTHRRDLVLLAHCFHQKGLEFETSHAPGPPLPSLSPREVDAMTFLALGYGRAQVAQSLSISEHTLRVYIESARRKLGAVNTVHAVALALNQGLIVI